MANRGFRWNDAMARAANALSMVHGADPKLANVGFVWPPLPTVLDTLGGLFYPVWPTVVSNGISAAFTSALCGGATAALLVMTARRLGLPNGLGWAFALLVAANPMVFLYSSNGMSEGVAAPFLVGAVCCLTLFWHTGQRMWIAASGAALAFAVLTEYQGVAYGAAVFVALAAALLWSREVRVSAPQGRGRAIEGLGLLLLVPPVFAGCLWLAANAVIMGDPLDFIYGDYGYKSFQEVVSALPPGGNQVIVTGDVVGALVMVGERVWPFFIPLAFILAARLLDRRLLRIDSLSLTLIGLSVPLGMVVPMAVLGSSMGFLRYLINPLFVAAGWGLWEISRSRRRRTVAALVLAGWVAAFPASLWIMSDKRLGLEERTEVKALLRGGTGTDSVVVRAPVARYLASDVLPSGRRVLFDSVAGGSLVAIQIPPEHAGQLILTSDRRFKRALRDPRGYGIGYFLMPDPAAAPTAAIGRAYPRLWNGGQPGFRLMKTFTTPLEKWRVYAVLGRVRHAPRTTGGRG
jgi:4-amino-4-deoxy-L-arabinose transferase-like glycosyltransferase